MRIGEVAQRAGASAKAVRRYESLGLIAPRRLANGYRTFGEQDVRVVRELRALREPGIPAERTRPFLECLAAGAEAALGLPTFEARGARLRTRLTLIVRDGAVEHVFHPIDEPGEHAGQVQDWLKGTP